MNFRDLYWALVNLTGSKINASMYLNSKDIPGHRFWDRGSRDAKAGTHNFVIWNMSRVQMVGIDPDSDQEAIDYYNRIKQIKDGLTAVDEQYHQVLGVEGARQLDRFDGNNWRMSQLDMAIEMTNKGKDAKSIRLATNWELAPDGKWRYEIMDGDLDTSGIKKVLKAHKGNYPFSVTLQEVHNNPELYRAYPQLATLKVVFRDDMKMGTNGRYNHDKDDFSKSRITINTK